MDRSVEELLAKHIAKNTNHCPVGEGADVSICLGWGSDACWNCIIEYAEHLTDQ